jgi:hypothetical protein
LAGGNLEGGGGYDEDVGGGFAGGGNGEGGFGGVGLGFNEEGVGAAFDEGGSLSEEGVAGGGGGGVAVGFEEAAEGADVAEDAGAVGGNLPGDLGGGAVDVGGLSGEVVIGEGEGGAAKGVCGEEVGAGVEIELVDVADFFGVVEVPAFAGFAGAEAELLELRAGGAVALERAGGEEVAELGGARVQGWGVCFFITKDTKGSSRRTRRGWLG